MKLSLEQMKQITVGALTVWEEDGVFRFAKCTPKQVEAWYNIETVLGERAEATTGIRLDFHTDSHFFAFTTANKVNYECYVDNVLTNTFFEKDFADGMSRRIELDGKEHRITFYLPSHSVGKLASVELEDGASMIPHKFDCKILFIGDSITQGWESTWDSLSYGYHVSRFFNAESVVQGVGGGIFHVTTFDEAVDFDPDIVVVAYGTNDWHWYRTLEEGRDQCHGFLDLLTAKYRGKKLFGISPIWRADQGADDAEMGSFRECADYVKEEILGHGMILIDGETLTPHLPDFYSDGFLHPDTKGFGIYALNLIMQMREYL
ncbi:MAG: SGNH/GDSL hydrolase family protein [Lachnospiraceae bacterium]|nr:SGNH/GDSL hydrolase family protein [Lachnospiraceae bacterium]